MALAPPTLGPLNGEDRVFCAQTKLPVQLHGRLLIYIVPTRLIPTSGSNSENVENKYLRCVVAQFIRASKKRKLLHLHADKA